MQVKKLQSKCTEGCTNHSQPDKSRVKILKRPTASSTCRDQPNVTNTNSTKYDNMNSDDLAFQQKYPDETTQFRFKPLHVRLREYELTRERIFKENNCKTSRSANRMKAFWKKIKSLKQKLVCSILDNPSDVRPYAEVELFGNKMLGLHIRRSGSSKLCRF